MSYKRQSPQPVVEGGTGDQSLTAYAVLTGGTTSTGAIQSIAGVGTLGQVLTSNGAAALPTMQALPASGGVSSITGDSGGAQTGAITLTGGTSGAVFTGSAGMITESFDFLNLAATTTLNGQIHVAGVQVLHFFPATRANTFLGSDGGAAGSFAYSGGNTVGIGNTTLSGLTSGGNNTVVGANAGKTLTTGAGNTIFGNSSGNGYTGGAESYNILIGNTVAGTVSESHVIRIGNQGSGIAQQNQCFIAGITGVTVTGATVLCSTVGLLGTVVSSERFKDDIVDMGDQSSPMMKLRPVSFHMKDDATKAKSFGMIAEEVEEIMPELVLKDETGTIYSLKYHEMPAMLLNELQKLAKRVEELEAQLKAKS